MWKIFNVDLFTIVFKPTFIQRRQKTAGQLAVQTCPPAFPLSRSANTILLDTEAQNHGGVLSFFPFFSFQEVFNVPLLYAEQRPLSS